MTPERCCVCGRFVGSTAAGYSTLRTGSSDRSAWCEECLRAHEEGKVEQERRAIKSDAEFWKQGFERELQARAQQAKALAAAEAKAAELAAEAYALRRKLARAEAERDELRRWCREEMARRAATCS